MRAALLKTIAALLLGCFGGRDALACAGSTGMIVDNARRNVVVFDTRTDQVVGLVPLEFTGYVAGDCAIAPDGKLGFVTDAAARVWIIDLATSPPRLAAGVNPVPISSSGGDVAVTPDGRFILTCGSFQAGSAVSVLDAATREEVSAFSQGANCYSVDVCNDGTVLAATQSSIHRLALDSTGQLSETGDQAATFNPNIACAPDSRSAVGVANNFLETYTLPGMTLVEQRPWFSSRSDSVVVNLESSRLFLRGSDSVEAFEYSSADARVGATPLFSTAYPYNPYFQTYLGLDRLALSPDQTKLYATRSRFVPQFGTATPGSVQILDPNTGATLGQVVSPGILDPIGICVTPQPDSDGDGLPDRLEVQLGTNPGSMDSDGDGLPDLFEVRNGLAPLDPGDALADADNDGLRNLDEYGRKTDPRDPDSDNDGLMDGPEVLQFSTNPLKADTDGDRLDDRSEVEVYATNPLLADSDGGGASDYQEVVEDLTDPLAQADDLTAVGDPLTLTDGSGIAWQLSGDGRAFSSTPEFNGALSRLSVDGTVFFGGTLPLRSSPGGRTIQSGPLAIGSLRVSRKVYVPTNDSFARYTETLENPGAADLTVKVELLSTFDLTGSFVQTTSSGDSTLTTSDDFVVLGPPPGQQPNRIGFVYSGPNAAIDPITSELVHASTGDSFRFGFEVTVPAGERVSLMHFVVRKSNAAAAVQASAGLVGLPQSALATLAPHENNWVKNFYAHADTDHDGLSDDEEIARGTNPADADSDDDGLLDGFELRYGLNPLTPDATGLDLDSDGLDTLAEQAAGTHPGIADTDGDLLLDGEEVHVTNSNPRAVDSDGDGLDDYREARVLGTNPSVKDTDGGGASDFQETEQNATDPLSPGDDFTFEGYGLSASNLNGSAWNFTSDGSVIPYFASIQHGLQLSLDGIAFPAIKSWMKADRREFAFGPYDNGPLRVVRKTYVPEQDSFVRYLEVLENRGATPLTVTVTVESELGSDPETEIVGTSSGDLMFDEGDFYVVTDDKGSGGDPPILHVFGQSGARLRVAAATTTAPSDDRVSFSYKVTVPAGGRSILMHFAGREQSRAEALQQAARLGLLGGRALERLSPAEQGAILDFIAYPDRDHDGMPDADEIVGGTNPDNPDTDGDGLSDGFEVRYGFNPTASGDAHGDPDGDGLDNLAEQAHATDPRNVDTDGDGLSDGEEALHVGSNPLFVDTDHDSVTDRQDNCPLTANADQADKVQPDGIGDACEDTDGDGVVDLGDNCPVLPNASQVNADADRLGDACDPYPNLALRARWQAPAQSLVSTSTNLILRLEDRDGILQAGLTGIRVTATLSGSATFDGGAGHGGQRALVEFVNGTASLSVLDALPEVVTLGGEDTDSAGVELSNDIFEDFESSDGEFTGTGNGAHWTLGHPYVGAASGQQAWMAAVSYLPQFGGFATLLPPPIDLPFGTHPRLQYRTWLGANSGSATISIASKDVPLTFLRNVKPVWGSYRLDSVDLSAYAGSKVQLQFQGAVTTSSGGVSWFLDDFAILNIPRTIEFLDPDGDPDHDGTSNAEELRAGTDVHDFDSDNDLRLDGPDNCGTIYNPTQADAVHPNGVGDACDDPDGDSTYDDWDNCADTANPGQENRLHPNRPGDACDDPDQDGVADAVDNCLDAANPAQEDDDGDEVGNMCDVCPSIANPAQLEAAGCAVVSRASTQCLQARVSANLGGRLGTLAVISAPITVPASLTFETNSGACFGLIQPVDFLLNGTLVGRYVNQDTSCDCIVPLQSVVVDDAALLNALWKPEGNNIISIIKSEPVDSSSGAGTYLSWFRVVIGSPQASAPVCLYDLTGTDCTEPDSCRGYTGDPVTLSVTVAPPYTPETVHASFPFQATPPSETLDISGMPNGLSKICISAEKNPILLGTSGPSLVRLNTTTGLATTIGDLPFAPAEIEFDDRTGRAYAHSSAPFMQGLQEFDVHTGKAIGSLIRNLADVSGLEFANGRLFGVIETWTGFSSISQLYEMSLSGGVSRLVGSFSTIEVNGLAFDENTGTMYAIGYDYPFAGPSLFGINLANGQTTGFGRPAFQLSALEFGPDGWLYTSSFLGGPSYGEQAGDLLRLSSTGVVTRVGASGLPIIDNLTLAAPERLDCIEFDKQGESHLAINASCNGDPVALASVQQRVECGSPAGGAVSLDASGSSDPDSTPGTQDGIARFEWFEDYGSSTQRLLGEGVRLSAVLPLGDHSITLRVTDTSGLTDTAEAESMVVDSFPPTLTVHSNPMNLWPPNHRLVDVEMLVNASDACSTPQVTLLQAISNEPDDAPGGGDGNTTLDIQDAAIGAPDTMIRLRAERDTSGSGRRYSILYRAVDSVGHTTDQQIQVPVPHDQGGISEPLELDLYEGSAGTVVAWNSIHGANYYNVVRGNLKELKELPDQISLGAIGCIEAASLDASTENHPDAERPHAGEAFFYLVEYNDGWSSTYGSFDVGKPRIRGSGGCDADRRLTRTTNTP